MTVYQLVCWFPNIKPEHRNSRNLSDGAIFARLEDAKRLANRVLFRGGAIAAINEVENGTGWYESIDEYDGVGTMSADEIAALRARR